MDRRHRRGGCRGLGRSLLQSGSRWCLHWACRRLDRDCGWVPYRHPSQEGARLGLRGGQSHFQGVGMGFVVVRCGCMRDRRRHVYVSVF